MARADVGAVFHDMPQPLPQRTRVVRRFRKGSQLPQVHSIRGRKASTLHVRRRNSVYFIKLQKNLNAKREPRSPTTHDFGGFESAANWRLEPVPVRVRWRNFTGRYRMPHFFRCVAWSEASRRRLTAMYGTDEKMWPKPVVKIGDCTAQLWGRNLNARPPGLSIALTKEQAAERAARRLREKLRAMTYLRKRRVSVSSAEFFGFDHQADGKLMRAVRLKEVLGNFASNLNMDADTDLDAIPRVSARKGYDYFLSHTWYVGRVQLRLAAACLDEYVSQHIQNLMSLVLAGPATGA